MLELVGVPEIVLVSVPDCVFEGLPVTDRVLVGLAEDDRVAVTEDGPEPEAVIEVVYDIVGVTDIVEERDPVLVGVRVPVAVTVGVPRVVGVPVAACEPEPEMVLVIVTEGVIVGLGVLEPVFVKEGVTGGLAVFDEVPDRVTLGVSVQEGVTVGVTVVAAVSDAVNELLDVTVWLAV